MQERGITRKSIDKFNLGYSYGSIGATKFPDLCRSELFSRKGKRDYDRFSNRIIIPVTFKERVVFVTSRAIGQHDLPHLHIYDSGEYFYNQDVLSKHNKLLLVESPLDVILLDQINIPAIASFGANAQPRINANFELLKNKELYICYDNDDNKSGIKGARQAAKILLSKKIKSKVVILPKPIGVDKIDIGDYLSNHSKEDVLFLLREAINSRIIVQDYQNQKKRRKKDDFIDKKDVATKGLRDIEKICCPFHGDTKPSLVIYHDTKSFYCFGCHRHGSLEELKEKLKNV